jgi:hypothetical protein
VARLGILPLEEKEEEGRIGCLSLQTLSLSLSLILSKTLSLSLSQQEFDPGGSFALRFSFSLV